MSKGVQIVSLSLLAVGLLAACAHEPQKTVMAPEGPQEEVAIQKAALDKQIMENAGVLGALRDSGSLDGVFGSSSLDSNLSGIGGLIGAKGTQIGTGGLGMRGSGVGGGGGGGGLGAGGIGGLGTLGRGGGGAVGVARPKAQAGLTLDNPKISGQGTLEHEIVRRVLFRHSNALKYCYARELSKLGELEGGKLRVQFTVDSQGSVTEARAVGKKTFNDTVSECAVRVFKRLRFPTPTGGEVSVVQDLVFKTVEPKAP